MSSFDSLSSHATCYDKKLKNTNKNSQSKLIKPEWLKIKVQDIKKISQIKNQLRAKKLSTVCEEANCPNLCECFAQGTITLMIMGKLCTRRCPFCDVKHGKTLPLDENEPEKVANICYDLGAKFVVLTSVNRDDLRDGGALHFANCNEAIRKKIKNVRVENLVPDFRNKQKTALLNLAKSPPDVFNHNIETVKELYKKVRPGADYQNSLLLLNNIKRKYPKIHTKSGFMLGLGETKTQIKNLLQDLKKAQVDSVTIGQYLQPSPSHLTPKSYISPQVFKNWQDYCFMLGFKSVASAPLVRSSYQADKLFLESNKFIK
jgi:lipoyl synthase